MYFMLHCLDTLDHRITNYSILLAHSWITANFLFVNKPSEPIMNWLSRRRQTLHSSGQIQVQFHNQRKLDRPKKRIAHCSRHVALSLAHVAIKFISKGVPCKNFQLGFVTALTIERLFLPPLNITITKQISVSYLYPRSVVWDKNQL